MQRGQGGLRFSELTAGIQRGIDLAEVLERGFAKPFFAGEAVGASGQLGFGRGGGQGTGDLGLRRNGGGEELRPGGAGEHLNGGKTTECGSE